MTDEVTEAQDSPTPEADTTVKNESVVESPETPDVNQDIKTLQAQKEHWRKKYDEVVKKTREAVNETVTVPEAQQEAPPQVPVNDIEDRVELRLKGYSADEIAFMQRVRSEGQNLLDVEKETFVQGGIKELREQAKVAEATPSPSTRTGVANTVAPDKTVKPSTWEDKRQQRAQAGLGPKMPTMAEWKAKKAQQSTNE